MELAKVTLRGQITIPAEIRKKLGVKDGDKVVFIEENGRIEDVDLFITGDDDFDDVKIEKPKIITSSEFMEKF